MSHKNALSARVQEVLQERLIVVTPEIEESEKVVYLTIDIQLLTEENSCQIPCRVRFRCADFGISIKAYFGEEVPKSELARVAEFINEYNKKVPFVFYELDFEDGYIGAGCFLHCEDHVPAKEEIWTAYWSSTSTLVDDGETLLSLIKANAEHVDPSKVEAAQDLYDAAMSGKQEQRKLLVQTLQQSSDDAPYMVRLMQDVAAGRPAAESVYAEYLREIDMQKSLVYERKAAEKGNANSQAVLAFYYFNGISYGGVSIAENHPEAYKWARLAVDNGELSGSALFMCGYLKLVGEDVPHNEYEGAALIRRAAELGNQTAKDYWDSHRAQFEAVLRGQSGASTSSDGGCYIATCVYGSYDCPQVWTLRRYRDNILAETALGRLFIRFYYAVSPHIVSVFGKNRAIRNLWKKPLDSLVNRLKASGVEDTPYND